MTVCVSESVSVGKLLSLCPCVGLCLSHSSNVSDMASEKERVRLYLCLYEKRVEISVAECHSTTQ